MTKSDKFTFILGNVLIAMAIVNLIFPNSNIINQNFKNGISVFTFFYALSAGLTTISESIFRKLWNKFLGNFLYVLAISLGGIVGFLTGIDFFNNNIIVPIVDNFIANGTLMMLNLGLLFVNIWLNEKKEEQKEKKFEQKLIDEVHLAKKEMLQQVLENIKKK
ncbi:hypothetical protein [Bacillus nitratireducens]|uniref:hypothetical protein n=1 Tax=Bacillus nitratireducens TaxID=2026193 RepID=UPI0033936325